MPWMMMMMMMRMMMCLFFVLVSVPVRVSSQVIDMIQNVPISQPWIEMGEENLPFFLLEFSL